MTNYTLMTSNRVFRRRLPLSRKHRGLWNPRTLAKGVREIRVELQGFGNQYKPDPILRVMGIQNENPPKMSAENICILLQQCQKAGRVKPGWILDQDQFSRSLHVSFVTPVRISSKLRQRYGVLADLPKPPHQ